MPPAVPRRHRGPGSWEPRQLVDRDCGTTLLKASAIAADVKALTGGVVTHLVMTHHHFDHILGSAGFARHLLLHGDLDLGGRDVHVEHPGRGHTDHDLILVVPPTVRSQRTVVLEVGGPEAVYVPGHGAVVDAAFVRRQRDWLARRGAASGSS